MPPKKASATGAAALQPLDPNQETLSLREARSQKRKATSPTPQEDELDREIKNMEMLHQQVQRKKEKMARLADLQRQIDEATKEVRHLAQDEQERRPQHLSFIKKACSMMMDGMMILIMVPLLLTMLLPWQQNCRLSHGPHHISHLSFQCMMGIQI
jgi:nitrate/nitrite-specific signal transduction histidine kinase